MMMSLLGCLIKGDTMIVLLRLTGLRVGCSRKLSSSTADWSLDSRSFFLDPSMPQLPSSSSLPPRSRPSSPMTSLRFAGSSGISRNLFSEDGSIHI
jgi:hypothetical protein